VYDGILYQVKQGKVETRELAGERYNARNNDRCMQARKIMHGLDGQHHYVDRTPRGTVNQNNKRQR